MSKQKRIPIVNRYDFAVLFDATDSNPNGDPDANNMPRHDPETMHGLVTDGCIKRKIRNTVALSCKDDSNMRIFVAERGILADRQQEAYDALGIEADGNPNDDARRLMCEMFWDIRAFGAVMNSGKNNKGNILNCGQVTGAVQIGFSRSIDPISPIECSITRVALTNFTDTNAGKNAKKKAAQTGEQLDTSRAVSGQMGSKWIIPYGLYMVKGYVSPSHADRCGFSEEDLQTLWNSILTMFDNDRSAARPNMATRELFIFKHDSYLGNASPARTVDTIKVVKNPDVSVPRSFDDYTVTVPNPPQFIKVIRMTPDEFAYPK